MVNSRHFIRKTTQDNMITERFDVIKNRLLGDYNDDGKYVISPQIVKELLTMEKVKRTAFGNSIFCVGSLLGYGEIVFELYFDNATKNGKSAVAILYVLEEVDKINGYLINTIKTQLEEFAEDVDNFIEVTYKHFHIVESDDDDDEVLEQKNLLSADIDSSYILAKKQYSLYLEKLLDEKYLDAYGKYFTYRLSALTKLENPFTIAVLNSFNSQYAKIEKMFLKNKNFKMLNELLDKSIEEISGTKEEYISQEQEFRNATADALESFTESAKKLNAKYEDKALSMLDKEDRSKVETMKNSENEQNNQQNHSQDMEQIVKDVKANSSKEKQQKINEKSSKEKDEDVKINDSEENSVKKYLEEKQSTTKENKTTEEKVENSADKSSYYDSFMNSHQGYGAGSVHASSSSTQSSEKSNAETPTQGTSLMDRINRRQEALDSRRKSNSELINQNNVNRLKDIQREIDDGRDM